MKSCSRCGSVYDDSQMFCSRCGAPLNTMPETPPPYGRNGYYRNSYPTDNAFDASGPQGKSRGVAALLAILLGGLGVQYFYLGKVGGGFICILLTLATCGIWDIISLIQGIMMFCMTNADFQRKYVDNQSTFPLF